MSTENKTLRAARAYHARGLAVFPLNGKVPVTTNGLHDASNDIVQVEEWFSFVRNIAIAIPAGVVVVDVDPRNGGQETFDDWCDSYGRNWFENVPEAQTGGGGLHFWFRYPGKLVKSIDGVDLLREGKYVVAPPSTTADAYKWVTALPDDLNDLPELPGWLRTIATPEDRTPDALESRIREPRAGGVDDLADAAHSYTTWESLLGRHGWKELPGNRWRHPDSENQFSATLKYDCLFVYSTNTRFPVTETGDPHGVTLFSAVETLDFGGDRKAFLRALKDAGYLADNAKPSIEISDLFDVPNPDPGPTCATCGHGKRHHIYEEGACRPGFACEAGCTQFVAVDPEAPQEPEPPEPSPEPTIVYPTDWKALKRKEDDIERKWLIEPIIAVERAHVLYAPAKVGKSLLMLPLAAAAATGTPFLEYEGGDPMKVVYADYEMTEDDLKERMEAFGYDLDNELLDFFVYAFIPASNGLDTPAGGAAFVRDCIEVHGSRLVIVDTMSRAVVGAENDADTVRNFYRYTGWPLKRAGVSVVRLDHAGKDAGKGQRGTSSKNDDVDIVWRMNAGKKGNYDLEATHARMGWVPRKVPLTLHTHPLGTIDWRMRVPEGGYVFHERAKSTAEMLVRLGAEGCDISVRAAGELLRANDWTGDNKIIGDALKWREAILTGGLFNEIKAENLAAESSSDHSFRSLDGDDEIERVRSTFRASQITSRAA